MDIRLAIVCSLSAALACGCGREGSPQAAATPDVISVRTSDASLALVEVGRETVTCGDVRARLAPRKSGRGRKASPSPQTSRKGK